jgi:O-succinylbenzoate synthase
VKLTHLAMHTLDLPLVAPFTTSFGTQTVRRALVFEVHTEVDGQAIVGWGECGALEQPIYSSEYREGVIDVVERFLLPSLIEFQDGQDLTAERVGPALSHLLGHRMAKSALEMAILDAQLRAAGQSFADYLGVTATRVPAAVSVGIHDSIPELLEAVAEYVQAGYQRIKLKIRPGWDIEPVRAVREAYPDIPLQVDANTAYTLADAEHLAKLDQYDLLLVEQPLGEEDIRQHSVLAGLMTTSVCLDESVVSVGAAQDAIELGAVGVINIKPSRVGGYLEAVRIHDLCLERGIPVWCGGMLETGIGRAANAALAGLPGFTLPGDISGSSRFYVEDITPAIEPTDGWITVHSGPGLCELPDRDTMERYMVGSVEMDVVA